MHYRPQTDSQVKETGLAPHSDALAIALNERVRGEDDVGIPQEKSHSLSDDGSAIDGVVVGVRDAECRSSTQCPCRAITGRGDASPPPQWGSTRGGGPPRLLRSLVGSWWIQKFAADIRKAHQAADGGDG